MATPPSVQMDAATIARAHDAATIALALFARLDDDGKGDDSISIEIERALVAAGATPPRPRQVAPAPTARADRYRRGRSLGSGGIQEIGDDGALAETCSAKTLGEALIVRLRADGRSEAATAIRAALQALNID